MFSSLPTLARKHKKVLIVSVTIGAFHLHIQTGLRNIFKARMMVSRKKTMGKCSVLFSLVRPYTIKDTHGQETRAKFLTLRP